MTTACASRAATGGEPDVVDSDLLEMRGIVKQFPGVRALDGVELSVRPGEVHCLLGQNGAGKSTLIKLLAGAHQPNEGEIRWNGDQVVLSSPTVAIRHGISTIYQELDLVDGLSVAENVYLGHEISTGGFSRRGEALQRTRELLARLGHQEIPPTRDVGRLSAANKQVVSMARAMSHDSKAADHGRAFRDPRPVGGPQPVPGDPRPHPAKESRSSTSRTDSRRFARSATGSPC